MRTLDTGLLLLIFWSVVFTCYCEEPRYKMYRVHIDIGNLSVCDEDAVEPGIRIPLVSIIDSINGLIHDATTPIWCDITTERG